ncbi:hypothetical protein ACJJTC_018975 [Scirpophaga incertulas]
MKISELVMRWCVLVVAALVVAASTSGPRRCAGRAARERLKAAEKVRDKRYYVLCCAPACSRAQRRPPPTTRKYQPYHNLCRLRHDPELITQSTHNSPVDVSIKSRNKSDSVLSASAHSGEVNRDPGGSSIR